MGYTMKRLKIVVSLLLLILVVILSGELYQQYLGNFTNQFYYFTVGGDDGCREELLSQIVSSCQKNGVDVFSYRPSVLSRVNQTITIYATSTMERRFRDEYNISAGRHISLFSGETNILLEDFADCVENNVEKFYFTGSMEQVLSVKSEIAKSFGVSYVHSEPKVGIEWLIYAVWGVVFAVILLLTWFDVEFSKKEMFIRVSMGASRRTLVLEDILLDSALLTAAFFAVRLLYESRFDVSYNKAAVSLIFGVFLLLNASVHCTLFASNYKQIIYGANISTGMLSNCYVLKALSLIVAVLSLSVNCQFIVSNVRYMRMYGDIDRYEGYSFLSLEVDKTKVEPAREPELHDTVASRVFFELYFKDNVALSSFMATDRDGNPFIITNKNAQGTEWIKGLIQNEEKAELYILVPSRLNWEETVSFAVDVASSLYGDYSGSAAIRTVVYDTPERILFFESTDSTAYPYGFDVEESPLIIYLDFVYNETYSVPEGYMPLITMWDDIMFHISENDIAHLTGEIDGLMGVSTISVAERCAEYRHMFIRLAALNTILSIFMLLLEFVIVTTIIRMEYTVNAREFTIKKILGYSVWEKNKTIILLNLFSAGIGFFTAATLSLMFHISSWVYDLGAALLLAAAELVLMICYARKTERTSVQKVLKGGGL